MALVVNDRVRETSTSTGTGTINLAGAATGFETFVAGIGNSNTTFYSIVNSNGEFEVGQGTVTDASPDTLSRDTILSSSNSDSAVDFSAGTKDVFCTLPASRFVPGKFGGTNFDNSILVGHATTGTLNGAIRNVGVGHNALDALTSGDNNVAIGYVAGTNINSGSSNIAIGSSALTTSTGATNNVAIGLSTLQNADGSTTENTAIGNQAGLAVTSGNVNTFLGFQAGANINSGSGNVIIGQVNADSATGDRQLKIAGHDGSTTTTWISGTNAGAITFNSAYTFPTADGSAGKVLTTDGSGTLTFETPTTGDITGVTAGTNLTGGGTSGDVTINLADASTSAKGAASFSSDNFAASSGAITIKDSGVATAEIQDDAVTTAKIADSNVTLAKMAANSVDSNQYVDGSIDTAHIANDQITNALMADNAIDTAQIAASAVETAKINDNAVTLAKMASGTDGNIISYDASGNPVAIATGSSGQVLTSGGAGAQPSFQTPTVGDITSVVAGTGLTGGGTSGDVTLNVAAGNLIDVQADQVDVDLSELSTSTSNGDGDFFCVVDSSNGQKKLTKGNINNSGFNNDAGFTTNTGTVTSVGISPGTGLDAGSAITSSGTISVTLDLSELTDMTATMTGSDEFIVLDSSAERRKAASEIGLSIFNNDAGFTTNTGDITSVVAGSGLTGGATSGAATLNIGAGTGIDVAADAISVDVSDFMANGSNNRIVTATGADAQNAEANLTFDGSTLDVSGTLKADKGYVPEATLTDGSTINWNMSTQSVCKVTLAGNRTMAAPSNGSTGQFASITVIQDGTGSRTLTWNAVYEFAADTAPTLSTTANKADLFVFRYNGSKWLEVGRNLLLTVS